MPKIKIIIKNDYDLYDYDAYYDPVQTSRKTVQDWIEVSQEELDLLNQNNISHKLQQIIQKKYNFGLTGQIVVFQEPPPEEAQFILKDVLKDLQAEKLKLEKTAQKAAATRKRNAENKKKKELEKARKLLEEAGQL